MVERRRLRRRHLIYYLRVFNHNTGRLMGHLVDLTEEGIMVISEAPIETDVLFQLRMVLPEELDSRKELDFKARSLWCKKDLNPDFYDTGFQLIDVSAGDARLLENLIQTFAMDSE